MSIRLVVAGVILATTLVGCAASPGEPEPTAAETNASPSATPSPTKPALDELVLEPGGLGDLKIGQPVPTWAPGLATAVFYPDVCVAYNADGSPGDVFAPGYWVDDYPDITDGMFSNTVAFSLETAGRFTAADPSSGPITVINVGSPRIRTAAGVHVGSTYAEVLAAYPEGFTDSVGFSGFAIEDSEGRLTMVLDDPSLEEPTPETAVVVAMYAVPAGTEFYGSLRSDAYPGCA